MSSVPSSAPRSPVSPGPPPAPSVASACGGPDILLVEFFSRGGLFHYSLQLGEALARGGGRVVLLTARDPELRPGPASALELWPRLWTWNPRSRRAAPGSSLLARFFRHCARALRAGRYLLVWAQIVTIVFRARPRAVLLGDLEHRCDAWFCAALRRLRPDLRLADVCHNVRPFERHLRASAVSARDSNHVPSAPPLGFRSAQRSAPWRPKMLRRIRPVFVHGPEQAREYFALVGREPILIPHGAGDEFAALAGPDPQLRARWSLAAEQPLALLFGALTKYKGVEWLLAALAATPPASRPVIAIVGYPALDALPREWKAFARDHALDAWLRWRLEYVPSEEVAWHFRAADFLVLPYLAASQSGVGHLALAFGKPLLVSDAGGLSELVTPEENGCVIPVGDVARLSLALRRLAADAALRAAMGRASRRRAERDHDWAAVAAAVRARLLP